MATVPEGSLVLIVEVNDDLKSDEGLNSKTFDEDSASV